MKTKRSQATDIPMSVKQKVWERDGGRCIICGNAYNVMPNAHILSRAKGGLGIETNIINSRLVAQKQLGLYSVYVHPVGGQMKLSDLKVIISTLEKFDDPEIRLSMTEGVYFRNLNGKEAEELLDVTKAMGGTTSFDYSVACIGVPTCQIGICESQEALRETLNYVKDYIIDNNQNKSIFKAYKFMNEKKIIQVNLFQNYVSQENGKMINYIKELLIENTLKA